MQILCSDTNAIVSGYPVPPGHYSFPLHGTLEVVTSHGCTTNIECPAGATLIIWPDKAAAIPGPEPWAFFLAGFGFVMLGVCVIAITRKAMGWTLFGVGREF